MKNYVLLALGLIVLSPLLVKAQLVASYDADKNRHYHMTLSKATEPSPRLRYRLVTADNDLRPGNAAAFWYRAMLDLDRSYDRVADMIGRQLAEEGASTTERSTLGLGKDAIDAWRDPLQSPLSDLPVDKTKNAADDLLGWRRGEIVEAAARERCEWELGVRQMRGPESIAFMLPEFQGMRDLSRALCLEARTAIAEGRFDDALDTLRINQELGLACSEPPFYVCRLIGGAISEMGFRVIRDLECQPGAPSLYWALTDLPRPIIDGRGGVRFEAGLVERMFELLDDPEHAQRTAEEWDRLLIESLDSLAEMAQQQVKANPPHLTKEGAGTLVNWIKGLRTAGADHPGVKLARQRLQERGFDLKELDAMPSARLLAIDAKYISRVINEAVEGAFQAPWPEGAAARNDAVRQLNEAAHPLGDLPDREVIPFATLTAAATQAAATSLMAREREVAVLRLIEALRLHAGQTGKLPASLDEVEAAPVPFNPMTGKSFDYRLDGKTAHLTLPNSDGPPWEERYELTLAE